MPDNPTRLLRGLLKLVAVVVGAGLVGAGMGIGLAKLAIEEEETAVPDVAAPVEPSTPATSVATTTATTAEAGYFEPRVEVLSAVMGDPPPQGGSRRVTLRVRLTNRNPYRLRARDPALKVGSDELPLAAGAQAAARSLLRDIPANGRASGRLRFTVPAAVARRVLDRAAVKLLIAGRTISIRRLETSRAGG